MIELAAAFAALCDRRMVRLLNESMDDDVPEQGEAFTLLHRFTSEFQLDLPPPPSAGDGLAAIERALEGRFNLHVEEALGWDCVSAAQRVLAAAHRIVDSAREGRP